MPIVSRTRSRYRKTSYMTFSSRSGRKKVPFSWNPQKLFSSVRNRCLNHLEQLKVRNKYQEQILQKGDITGLLTWEYYVESELQEHIEKAIRQLPPQCQKIFIMNRFNDKSITQIAEELEISPRTVEKHIEIALKKLRQELADYLPAGLLLWLLNI